MPLKILARPGAQPKTDPEHVVLKLDATPYLAPGSTEVWDLGVHYFHCWMVNTFGVGKMYGDFQLAEKLNVHRIISDTWLTALIWEKRCQGILHPRVGMDDDRYTASGFIVNSIPKGSIKHRVEIEAEAMVAYDPWTDRSLDGEVDGAKHADEYLDRFYSFRTSEHFIFKKSPLILQSGYYFEPVSLKDHPRYENTAEAKEVRGGGAPPVSWRDRVEQAARGERTFRRQRTR